MNILTKHSLIKDYNSALSLKNILFLSVQTTHNTAPILLSTKYLPFSSAHPQGKNSPIEKNCSPLEEDPFKYPFSSHFIFDN